MDFVLGGPPISDDKKERRVNAGLNRRTLNDISHYPEPEEIYDALMSPPTGKYAYTVDYKTRRDFYYTRDTSLPAILYLLALRISEALRLNRSQFIMPYEDGGREDSIIVRGIYLSKRRYKNKPRLTQYRDDAYLPLNGRRRKLTMLVVKYLQLMDRDAEIRREQGKRKRKHFGDLYKFRRSRAYQITEARTGATNHWFRGFGEVWLYVEQFDYDLLALSDYLQVDQRTLSEYIRLGHRRHIKKKGVV